MPGARSTTAALGEPMTLSEVGKQKDAESGIVDFLRQAGDALGSKVPPRKAVNPRLVDHVSPPNHV